VGEIGATGQLLALRASVGLGEPPTTAPIPPTGDLPADWSLFRKLLPYYSECARISAGTGLIQNPDRHRVQFQLLRPETIWWPRAPAWPVLSVRVSDLSSAFLEALYNRRGEPVFLGYPTDVVRTKDGALFLRPIALLRADWNLAGEQISFTIADEAATLNPDWASAMRRNRRMARVMDWLGTTDAEPDDGIMPVTTTEWSSLEDLAKTLGMFLASDLREPLDPTRTATRIDLSAAPGVFNAVAVYLVEQNRYTAGLRRDLAALANWSDAELERTALSTFFGSSRHGAPAPVLASLRLEEDQIVAAREALARPLTVITGPPGTGKSQAAAAIMASAALSGRSALFSSRHHQALDAVEERFHDMLPDRVVLARARPSRDGDFDFRVAIDALLSRHTDGEIALRLRRRVEMASDTWMAIDARFAAADRLANSTAAISAAGDEIERLRRGRANGDPGSSMPVRRSLWRRIAEFLGFSRRSGLVPGKPLDESERIRLLRSAEQRLAQAEEIHRSARADVERLDTPQSLPEAIEALRTEADALLKLLPDALEATTVEERHRLAALRGDLGLARDGETARRLWAENADLITHHFPLWAITALSVPSRVPLQPGLFDHVVIDEATTCDIAAAIPVLARARQAVVIGDPMQTGLVANLPPSREAPILQRAGLWVPGIGRYAYSQTSLFGLASTFTDMSRHMLRDHFRCHSEIATFISETFYGRRLTVLTDERALRPPAGARPGLHWTDVSGPIRHAGKGCISDSEATAIADHLHQLLEVEGYRGTVGVVTPFNKQAERIRQLVEQRLADATIERAALRIATGHAFQGDARDVILVSPCFAADMPQGAAWFVRQGAALFNVAVSRARAVCHVFGDLSACRSSDVRHLSLLARRGTRSGPATAPQEAPRFESPWEERLFRALIDRGLEPKPQYPLAGRRLDLALIHGDRKLDVEVDGETFHRDPDGFRKVSDKWRDHQIRGLGWMVLRFWVYELRDDMERCVDRIVHELG
jgi:very-short-patch-repair endonuclease